MIRILPVAVAALIGAAAFCPAAARTPDQAPAANSAGTTSADSRLKALYDDYARWDSSESAQFETADGKLKPADHLARVDPQSQARRKQYLEAVLRQLESIPANQLSPGEAVNAAVFRTIIDNSLIELRYRTWEMPFNSDSSFWTYLDSSDGFETEAGYRRYIGRLRDIPRYFDEQIANMRAGIARGFTVPKVTLTGRDKSIETFVDSPVAKSPFMKAFVSMPATIPAPKQAELRRQSEEAVRTAVYPAYRKLLDFYRTEYYPAARTTISAHDLPDGDSFYRSQVAEYTTTQLSPEDIHKIGLTEVDRIQLEMLKTMKDSGFKGTFAQFLHFLRTDPQFIATTPDQLLGVSSYVAKRVDGIIGDHFGLLPRARFGIIPVPDALAPFYTSGRGGLGNCMMNTYDLPDRPLYNIPVLTLHECEPGHSFQMAVAEEQKALPAFRRHVYFSGAGEGWGLYSEWLGNELGIYRTPYEKFGQLSYDMWRAARLVIDTGIHRYGWSRQQAIDYLASHAALSQHEVVTEVDRYISWPGQALSYKLGELDILKLRAEAQAALGPRFDEKGFHDTILALGSVPLTVLETQMRSWIRQQQAIPARAPVKD